MAQVLRFFQDQVQKQPGERARVRVLQGPEVGTTFVILGKSAVIGRSEDCGIAISDASASRKHAEIQFQKNSGASNWRVVDLGSANGILHNGKVVREASLNIQDTIEIGETILEFVPSELAQLAIIESPLQNVEKMQSERRALEEQKNRVRRLAAPNSDLKSANKKISKKTQSPLMKFGIAGLFLIGGFMIFSEDSVKPQKTAKTKKPEQIREPAGFVLKGSLEGQTEFSKSVDGFFKAGFREYREGNYLRAKQQFEMALQIDPNHALSKRYHQNTLTQVQNEIDDLFERGRKAEFSGKLKEAKGNYESILRLLSRDQDHPRYLQAKERLGELAKIGGLR